MNCIHRKLLEIFFSDKIMSMMAIGSDSGTVKLSESSIYSIYSDWEGQTVAAGRVPGGSGRV